MGLTNVAFWVTAVAMVCLLWFSANSICCIKRLRRLIEDADSKLNAAMNRADAFEQQTKILGEQLVAYDEMKRQIDVIALWMRDNCKAQIASGLHNGRGVGEMAVAYLSGQMPDKAVLPVPPCGAFINRNDYDNSAPVVCSLPTGHGGPHYSGGF